MPFKVLSHTSELKVKIKANSLKNLFKEGINALAWLLEEKKLPPASTKIFTLKRVNCDDTINLINLLNNILTTSHIKKRVYFFSSFLEFSSQKISIICKGYRVEKFKEDIKALTFHQSKIKKDKNNQWEINLIFDI